jgi:ArsR family transcriptional regulator
MREVLDITKAMADGSRLRTLMALGGGELCVCQIIELLGLAPSTVSKHLSILHQAGLIEARKEGRWMYYRLAGRTAPKPVKAALTWLGRSLAESPEIVKDRQKLQRILSTDPDVICKRQNKS